MQKQNDSLGARMKRYEAASDALLVPRTPLMVRLDGKGFSKYTKGLEKPMDEKLRLCMEYAAYELVDKVDGCRFAYVQSDEISLVLVDYSSRDSQPWFNYRVSKVLSIAASICTSAFIKAALTYMPEHLTKRGFPNFDARAWNIPKEEVSNAILWRQQDATRNSIQSLGRAHFSHRQLNKKNTKEIQEMLFQEKGINYNRQPIYYRRGFSLYRMLCKVEGRSGVAVDRKKIVCDLGMPIITRDRDHVENWLDPEPNYHLDPKKAIVMEGIKYSSFELKDS
jgi:tRNA(His) guanylyltransferase